MFEYIESGLDASVEFRSRGVRIDDSIFGKCRGNRIEH
jgi:hypothetical protein